MDQKKYELWLAARAAHPHDDVNPNPSFVAALEHFAAAVQDAERKRCQDLCVNMAFEFQPESGERSVLRRVATRFDFEKYLGEDYPAWLDRDSCHPKTTG